MTDTEKIVAWLDYAIQVNSDKWIETDDTFWCGRMVAYRNVKQRIIENEFDTEKVGD